MKLSEAIAEASLTIDCLLDDIEHDDLSVSWLEQDLIQAKKMITIIENNCEVKK